MRKFTDCFEDSLKFKRAFIFAVIIVLWSAGLITIQLTAQPEPEATATPIFNQQKNENESFGRCKKDAEAGSKEAQYELSIMYA